MQRFHANGDYGASWPLSFEADGVVYVTVTLDARDPDKIADSLRVEQVKFRPGTDISNPLPDDYLLFQILRPGDIEETTGVTTRRFTVDPEFGQVLVLNVSNGGVDDRSAWSVSVIVNELDTSPLVFEPLADADSLVAVEGATNLLTNTGPTLIYHQAAPTGILIQAGMLRLDLAARQVKILQHAMNGYDLSGNAAGAPITLLGDASFSLDDARIPSYLVESGLPETLGSAGLNIGALILDERGAVFDFLLILPEDLGGTLFQPVNQSGGDAVLDLEGRVLGGGVWAFNNHAAAVSEGGPPWLGLLDAETDQATLTWDEASERLTIAGEVFLVDLFRVGGDPAFRTSGGLFSDPDGSGLAGTLTSEDVDFSFAELPFSFQNLTLRLTPGTAGLEMTANTELAFAIGPRHIFLPAADASLVYDRTEHAIDSLRVTHTGLAEATSFGRFVLTDFSGGFVHEPAVEDVLPAANIFEAKLGYTLADDASGATLARLELEGNAHLDAFGDRITLELFDTVGTKIMKTADSIGGIPYGGTEIFGYFQNVSLVLPVLGDFTASRLKLGQGFSDEGQMQLTGEADITLPAELMALFDIEGTVQAQIDGLVTGTSAAESFVATIGQLGSSWIGTGEFGVRATLDGQAQLVGGLGFGDADPNQVAARNGGPAGATRINLNANAEGLAMRASGPVDAGDVVIIAPDGTEYRLADFAARGIQVLNDDASGVTLLVPNAQAGEWVLMAAAATGFSGYADLADLSLTISAAMQEGAPGLSLQASYPDGLPPEGYDWRIYADTDGSGLDGQLVYVSRFNGSDTLEIAFADLGLAPGNWHLYATLGSGALAPVSAYLPEPITITGVADLTIKADLVWRYLEAGEVAGSDDFPMLHVLLTNEGTAAALEPFIATNVPGFERIGLPSLAAGESRVFVFDSLRGLGLTREDGGIIVSTGHRGAEADRTDNTTLAADAPPLSFQARPDGFVAEEDVRIWSSVAENDSGAASVELVAGPLYGTVEMAANGVFFYQPDEHYVGGDVFTYRILRADGATREARAWLTLLPVNDAPEMRLPIDDTLAEIGVALDLDLGSAAIDPDMDAGGGDTLSFGLTLAGGGAPPAWISFDPATGRLIGTPGPGDAGVLDLTFTATDFQGLSVSDDFEIRTGTLREGTEGDDTLRGTMSADSLRGLGGADVIMAGAGNDLLQGGDGADRLEGGLGNDTIDGGDGVDARDLIDFGDATAAVNAVVQNGLMIDGQGGTDSVTGIEGVVGSPFDDTISGRLPDTGVLLGQAGNDSIWGWEAADSLGGGAGADTLSGDLANDTLTGDDGSDLLFGDEGADSLVGGSDADTIIGDFGDDTLTGGDGSNLLFGDDGADVANYSGFSPTSLVIRQQDSGVTTVEHVGADGISSGIDSLNDIESILTKNGLLRLGDLDEVFTATTTSGDNTVLLGTVYSGPVVYLEMQWFGGGGSEIIGGSARNDFIKTFGGDDAIDAGAGDDVLDGGIGSNFMTGGTGFDVFFIDGRGGTTTWSTITDWQAGEQLSLWGYRPGISQLLWLHSVGAEGYKGVTLHADLDGNGVIDTSVTWSGLTFADLPPALAYDGLLWFQ